MMKGFKLTTPSNIEVNFEFYIEAAPITCAAFLEILPFTKTFYHARVSGQEIWIDDLPSLNIIQENASVFTEAGEVVVTVTSKPLTVSEMAGRSGASGLR